MRLASRSQYNTMSDLVYMGKFPYNVRLRRLFFYELRGQSKIA